MLSNLLRAKDTPAPTGKVNKLNNASSAPVVQAKPIRVIPGMSPQMVAEAQQKAVKAAKKKEQKETTKETKAVPIVAEPEVKAPAGETKTEMTAVDIDKRMRALRKKLKLIEELKEKKVCKKYM